MSSKLIITDVENLQNKINSVVKSENNKTGIYISLNKTQKSMSQLFNKEKINISKIFFVDCVTSNQEKNDVLHIHPNDLDELSFAINTFVKEINKEKFLIIDALSTLLIYNTEKQLCNKFRPFFLFLEFLTSHPLLHQNRIDMF